MTIQRITGICEGAIGQLDLQGKRIVVEQEQQGKRVATKFTLSADVSVTTRSHGTLKLADLKPGQKVIVNYGIEPVGKRVAHTIMILEPMAQPPASSVGVRVAGN